MSQREIDYARATLYRAARDGLDARDLIRFALQIHLADVLQRLTADIEAPPPKSTPIKRRPGRRTPPRT